MKIVIANWKMNPGREVEAVSLAAAIDNGLHEANVEVVICPSFPHIFSVRSVLKKAKLGAQDISPFERGAYTGQVSGVQLANLGVKYVIVGHSETREHLRVLDAEVAKKVEAARRSGIVPIVCVGGGLAPADDENKVKMIIRRQLEAALHGAELEKFIVAYEPTWAIGSGRTPTPEHVSAIAKFIRSLIDKRTSPEHYILYGGSVNSNNAASFVDIDGFLVGGASLDAEEFLGIIKNFSK